MPKLLAPVAAALATTLATTVALLAAPADAVHHPEPTTASGVARGGSADDNPFATHPWGVYRGKMEPSWVAWNNATGSAKDDLAYIANKAKDHWFGHWNPNDKIADQVDDYIANSQDGDKDALVQMAIFRVVPWEHDACAASPRRPSVRRTGSGSTGSPVPSGTRRPRSCCSPTDPSRCAPPTARTSRRSSSPTRRASCRHSPTPASTSRPVRPTGRCSARRAELLPR